MKICVGNDPKSDGLLFYFPNSIKIVGSADYHLDSTVPSGPVFGYSYGVGIIQVETNPSIIGITKDGNRWYSRVKVVVC